MSTRDEAMVWAVRYFGDPDEKPEDYAEFADALIAEGWRKMPTENEAVAAIIDALGGGARIDPVPATIAARAILALMDGGSA